MLLMADGIAPPSCCSSSLSGLGIAEHLLHRLVAAILVRHGFLPPVGSIVDPAEAVVGVALRDVVRVGALVNARRAVADAHGDSR